MRWRNWRIDVICSDDDGDAILPSNSAQGTDMPDALDSMDYQLCSFELINSQLLLCTKYYNCRSEHIHCARTTMTLHQSLQEHKQDATYVWP
mmetsp:Transcript_32799/g.74891  ORF Transcript_32799/g.74891 Transcript_32799/m.74891 type:complete len:92 (-) Transcript_32799:233-508(-)